MHDDTYMLKRLAKSEQTEIDHTKLLSSMQNIELKDSVMYNEFYKYHPIHAFEKCNDICTCNET